MVHLLLVLICAFPAQPKVRLTGNELTKKLSENLKKIEYPKSKVMLSPSKYSSYANKTRAWVKLLDEDFESGMPAGWIVINGDGDPYIWGIGTFYMISPPDFGTKYCLYNDDAAGEGNISGDSIRTPILGIFDSTTYLYLSYGYGHAEYQEESLKVEVRYHDGVSWGDWQQLIAYGATTSGTDTFILNENNDSLQVMWLYRDNHTYYSWGWGSAFDNVLIEYFTPVENDAGMFSINSPISDTTIGTFVQVNGTVKNYGSDTFSFESGVNIYDPDLLIAFTQTVQVDNLPPSDTLNIDFGGFQLTKGGTHTLDMFTYALDDSNSSNDSLTASFTCFNYYWEALPTSSVRACNNAAVYDPVNDLFFIIGGDSIFDVPGYYLDVCLEYDPKTNTWYTRKPMPIKRAMHNASYRKGFIHALCGRIPPYSNTTRHDIYDINSDSWDTAAPAPVAVVFPGVATWQDSLIYLIGGTVTPYGGGTTGVYLYDASTNLWSTATSLPIEFSEGGVKIKGDSIFIIGGWHSWQYPNILLGEINHVNPTEINWSWGSELPESEIYSNALAIKKNKAYMIGGPWIRGYNKVWEYDIQNETWTKFPDYPTPAISQGNFAERRDSSDDSPVYCFMGLGDSMENPVTGYYTLGPTSKCYRLVELPLSIIEDEEKPKRNSISLNSTIYLSNEMVINCNIANSCDLKIYMYDVLGRQVFSHLEKNISAGSHQLNLETNLTNGIYLIRIEAGTFVTSEKILLIR